MRGTFIVFEGPDRSGKTTQARLLVTALQDVGIRAELWQYPDRTTPIGTMIDAYLKSEVDIDDHAIHLLFSANRWEKQKQMESKLMDGITLVVDRYAYSGAAFTSAKGVDLKWCKEPDTGLLCPDKVLYMDGTFERRGGFGEERYETVELQRKVRRQYGLLREDWWSIIDATGTVDEIHAACLHVVKSFIVDRVKF